LRKPLPPAEVREIEAAIDRFAMPVFRDQPLGQGEKAAFSRQFGPLNVSLREAAAANLAKSQFPAPHANPKNLIPSRESL
jgi:alpha-ketoglutarate-dependent taurine dioxygenase